MQESQYGCKGRRRSNNARSERKSKAHAERAEVSASGDDVSDFLSELEQSDAQALSDEYLKTGLVSDRDLQQALYFLRKPRFEDLRAEYGALWTEMAIRRSRLNDVTRIAERVVANRERYQSVGESTGVCTRGDSQPRIQPELPETSSQRRSANC
jgi:hypothetical protein